MYVPPSRPMSPTPTAYPPKSPQTMNSADSSGMTTIIAEAFGVTTRWTGLIDIMRSPSSCSVATMRTDLGGRRGSGPPGGEQRRQHGAELADEAEADDGARATARLRSVPACCSPVGRAPSRPPFRITQMMISDSTPSLKSSVTNAAEAQRRGEASRQDPEREERELAEVVDEAESETSQVLDRAPHLIPPLAGRPSRRAARPDRSSASASRSGSSFRNAVTRGSAARAVPGADLRPRPAEAAEALGRPSASSMECGARRRASSRFELAIHAHQQAPRCASWTRDRARRTARRRGESRVCG